MAQAATTKTGSLAGRTQRCPKCKSTDTELLSTSPGVIKRLYYVITQQVILATYDFQCNKCGHSWQIKNKEK